MIPAPTNLPSDTNLNWALRPEIQSAKHELTKDLFASLNLHVSVIKQLTNNKIIAWLPQINKDCLKIHELCQKILNGEVSGIQSLGDLTAPLMHMADHLENIAKINPFMDLKDVVKQLHEKIYEIQQTVQLKKYLELRENLQADFNPIQFEIPQMDEIMRPLSKWHFQNLNSENDLESISSPWKLNNLRNITLAGLICLGSNKSPAIRNLPGQEATDPVVKIVESVNTANLPEPIEKMDIVFHTHVPFGEDKVRALQQEVALMQSALNSASSVCVLPEWLNSVENVSYDVAGLENSIARLMDEAREFLSPEDQEAAKCGNKHLNLIKQAQLVKGLKLPGVVVPIPHGVPSDKVTQFLQKQVPQVFQEWAKLGALYENYKGTTPFLEDGAAQQHLKTIDQMIEKAFLSAGNNAELFQELVPADFQKWLQIIKENENYLMVRSTGSEDSRETANAGGNISRNYVAPTVAALSKALGDVVRSYFSYSSLQNRINAQLNPFKAELKMAVTAQELIGEPVGGSTNPQEIPISLVLFSSEPLYVGGEKFRAMRLSGTFGHGEGVVGNQGIATDTVLILISEAHPDKLYILYENHEKPERLAPIVTSEGIKLGKVSNPPSMQNQRVFDETLLHRLYLWGVLGEKFFDNHPSDMEIVVKGKTIFPVQARPVNRPDLLPTYVDLIKISALQHNPIIQKLEGEIIVPGQGSVVIIDNSEEILFATSLEEAGKAFKKDIHKVVIVSRPEPANSHPVVNFSGLGIPCLVAPHDSNDLINQMSKEHLIVVDVQRGRVNLWDKQQGIPENYISNGFAVHPAKIAISLPLSMTLPIRQEGQHIPQDIRELILNIRSATTHRVAAAKLKQLRQHGWLQDIKQSEQHLKAHFQQMEFVPIQLWQGLTLSSQLVEKIEEAFDEAEAVYATHSEDKLRPLLHVKVIENLLTSSSHSGKSLAQYTAIDITPLHKDLNALIAYQKELSHPAHFADIFMLGSQGLTAESELEWRFFLKELEPLVQSKKISEAQMNEFKQMVRTMESTELFPTWLTLFFPKAIDSTFTPQEKLTKLLETLPANEAPIINYFLNLHKTLKTSQGKIILFSHPNSFENGWDGLQDLVGRFQSHAAITDSNSLIGQLGNSSPFTKMLAFKIMQGLVDIYDLSIKAMKASSAWTKNEQVILFRRMLEPYLKLLLDWGKYINTKKKYEVLLEKLDQSFKKILDNNPDQLSPSMHFSVTAAMIGSETSQSYILDVSPKTLEDVFTLIHQNLLIILSSESNLLCDKITLNQASIPDALKEIINTIETTVIYKNIMQRLVLEINEEGMRIKYNLPLRDHAAQVWLEYNKFTNEFNWKGILLGENERSRWDESIYILEILNALNILSLAGPSNIKTKELQFSWKVNDPKSIPLILQEWKVLIDLSLSLADRSYHRTGIIPDFMQRLNISPEKLSEFLKSCIQEKNYKIILQNYRYKDFIDLQNKEINQLLLTLVEEGTSSKNSHLSEVAFEVIQLLINTDVHNLDFSTSIKIASASIVNKISSEHANSVFHSLIMKNQGIEEFITSINTLLLSNNLIPDYQLYQILDIIISKGHGFTLARAVAVIGIKNSDMIIRDSYLQLLGKLGDLGDQKAIETLCSLVLARELLWDYNIYIIFESWIRRGQGIVEVAKVANFIINSSYKKHYLAFSLLEQITEYDEVFPTIISALRIGMHSSELDNDVDLIIGKLLKKENVDYQVINLLRIRLNSDNFDVKKKAFKTFEAFIKKGVREGVNLDLVLEELQIGTRSPSMEIKEFAFKQLKLLIAKGEKGEKIISILNDVLDFKFYRQTFEILEIFKHLVIKGTAYSGALKAASEGFKSTDYRLQSIEIFKALFDKNEGFAVAEELASQGLESEDLEIRKSALNLFEILFESEQGNYVAMRYPSVYQRYKGGFSS